MSSAMHREMLIPSDTSCLHQVRLAVVEMAAQGQFAPGKANLIALAVDEAIANIMEHAFSGSSEPSKNQIQVVLDLTVQRFEVIIRDTGIAYDPRNAPDVVDMREHVKSGKTGGLGICLMRRIMDEINYTYKQGTHNELQMIKYTDEGLGKSRKNQAAAV